MSYLKTIYSKPDLIRPWEVGIGRGMKEGGDVMFYFISFDYFQYFRDQIPKGGFQDSGCPKDTENLGLGDLCLKYNDTALLFLEAQSSCSLTFGLVPPPVDIYQNTILRSVNFNEIIFNYHHFF